MSKEIDQRVVEMSFDNKNFENNVKTTMSTLDKLKKALHLDGAVSGLENIDSASKKVNMDGLSGAVEKVTTKFSALQVMGITALANITNSAVNAGAQLAKSLSIDQVTAGWNKYEQKTANVQTLVNATGKSVTEVNSYLNELMWYSDETSYGYTDMISSLAQLTTAGGNIDTLIPMIEGVANATAYAGKGAAEFSRSMYNLNQSYSAGYLQYMDWKSLDLAGTTSKQLKQTLIDAAVALGKIKEGDVTISNFSQTLQDKWADTSVMEAGFGKFAELSQAAYKAVASGEYETAAEAIDALSSKYSEVSVKGFTAAQEAKSFTEAISATKDAVSSGWMRTFELVFGTYDKAKETWIGLTEWLWEIFASGAEARNNIIKQVMDFGGNPYSTLMKKLEGVSDSIKTITGKVTDYGEIVDKIINGDFGSGQARFDALTEAGYDWAHAQNLVNEKLGSTVRIATDYSETQETMIEATIDLTDAKLKELGLTEEEIVLYRDLEKQAAKTGMSISDLVASMNRKDGRSLLMESFSNIGNSVLSIINSIKEAWSKVFAITPVGIYGAIKSFNDFTAKLKVNEQASKKLTTTFKGLFDTLDLVLKIIKAPFTILTSIIKETAKNLDIGVLDVTSKIGSLLSSLHDWVLENGFIADTVKAISKVLAAGIKMVSGWINAFVKSKTVSKIISNLFGIFKTSGGIVIDIVKDIYDGTAKWFGKLKESKKYQLIISDIGSVFSFLGDKVEWVTGKVYDWLTSFRETRNKNKTLQRLFEIFLKIGSAVVDAAIAVWDWGKSILASEKGKAILSWIVDIFETLSGYVVSLVEDTWNWISALTSSEGFKEFLGILSGLLEKLIDIGGSLLEGFANGIEDGSGGLYGIVRSVAKNIIEAIKDELGIHSPSQKGWEIGRDLILGVVQGISDTAVGLFSIILETFTDLITLITDKVSAAKLLAIGTAGAIVYAFKRMLDIADTFSMAFKGAGQILGSVSAMFNELNLAIIDIKKAVKFRIYVSAILQFALSLAILAASVFLLAQLPTEKLWSAVGAVAALAAILVATVKIILTKKLSTAKIVMLQKMAGILMAIAAVLVVLAGVAIAMSGLSWEEYGHAAAGIGLLIGAITLIMVSFLLLNKIPVVQLRAVGLTLIQIAAVLIALAGVAKIMSSLSWEEFTRAAFGMGLLVGTLYSVMLSFLLLNLIPKEKLIALGLTLLAISGAMILLAVTAKIIGSMSWEDFAKAIIGLSFFTNMIITLVAILNIAPANKLDEVGETILSIAASMILLSITAKIIASMSWGEMLKAMIGLGFFTDIIIVLVAVLNLAPEKKLERIGTTILAISASMILLAIAAKIMGSIEWKEFGRAAAGLLLLAGIVSGLVLMLNLVPEKKMAKITAALTSIAIALALLAGVALVLGVMPIESLAKGVIALAILGSMLAFIMSQAKSLTAKSIVPLVIICLLLGEVFYAISVIADEGEDALYAAGAISLVLLAMAVSMKILSGIKLVAPSAYVSILILTLVVVALALVLKYLSDVNPDTALATAVSLSLLLVALSVVCLILAAVGTFAVQALLGIDVLVVLVAAMAILIGVLGGIALLTKDTAISLEELLDTGIPLLIKIGTAIGEFVGNMVKAFASKVLDLIPIIGIKLSMFWVTVQPFLKGITSIAPETLEGALRLVAIMVLMAGVELISALTSWMGGGKALLKFGADLCLFGPMVVEFAKTMSALTSTELLALMMSATAIGYLADVANKVPKRGGVAKLLAGENGLMGFAKELNAMGPEILSYAAMMADEKDGITFAKLSAIKMSATAIGYICEVADKVPKRKGLVSLITGENSLSGFAEELCNLAPALMAYSRQVSLMGGVKLDTIKSSTVAIGYICEVADKVPKHGGWLQTITGDNSLVDFAEELTAFAPSLMAYSRITGLMGGVKLETIKTSTEAIGLLCGVADEVPKHNGILQAITGDNSLSGFAKELYDMSESLIDYAGIMEKGMSVGKYDAVNDSLKAIGSMVAIAADIPKTDGLTDIWSGFSGLDTFTGKLNSVAEDFCKYANKLIKDMPDKGWETIKDSIRHISSFIRLALAVERDDDNKIKFISDFTSSLSDVGANLIAFANKMYNGMSDNKYLAVYQALNALVDIITLANTIPSLNILDLWFGTSTISGFTKQLEAVGEDICSYANYLIDNLPEGAWATVEDSIAKIKSLVSGMGRITIRQTGLDDLVAFADTLESLGEKLKSFYGDIKNIDFDKLSSIPTLLSDFASFFVSMDGIDLSKFKNFVDEIQSLGESSVGKFLSEFEDGKEDAKKAVESFITSAKKGVTSKEDDIKKAFTTLVEDISETLSGDTKKGNSFELVGNKQIEKLGKGIDDTVKTITSACSDLNDEALKKLKSYYSDFKSAGEYLAAGFAYGINASNKTLKSASIALANTTRDAIKKALDIASPSKVMYGLGEFTGAGFVNALLDYCSTAGEAGYAMAESAKEGLANAIATAKEFIDGKISDQPTIRPVLDLSDIESGARRINGLFSANQAVSVATRGTIGIQNGTSGCVINMTVNGAQGQDVNQLADLVSERLNNSIKRSNNTWR